MLSSFTETKRFVHDAFSPLRLVTVVGEGNFATRLRLLGVRVRLKDGQIMPFPIPRTGTVMMGERSQFVCHLEHPHVVDETPSVIEVEVQLSLSQDGSTLIAEYILRESDVVALQGASIIAGEYEVEYQVFEAQALQSKLETLPLFSSTSRSVLIGSIQPDPHDLGWYLISSPDTHSTFKVTYQFVEQHRPQVGGRLILVDKGPMGYMPAETPVQEVASVE